MKPGPASLLAVLLSVALSGCLDDQERATIDGWLTCNQCTGGERDSVSALAERRHRATVSALVDVLYAEAKYGPDIRRRLSAEYDLAQDSSLSRDAFIDAYYPKFLAEIQRRAALALGDIGSRLALGALEAFQAPPGEDMLWEDASAAVSQAIEANSGVAAAQIRPMVGYPFEAVPSAEVEPVPEVQVVSASGAPIAGAIVRFETLDGTVFRDSQRTNSSGLASAGGWQLGQTPGIQALTASLPGTQVPVAEFRVSVAGPPESLEIVEGDGQSAPAGSVVGIAPTVLVRSNTGPVPGAEVTFAAIGDARIARTHAYTNQLGIADAGLWRLGSQTGFDTLVATIDVDTVEFTATALAPGVLTLDPESGADQIGFAARDLPVPPGVRMSHPGGSAVGYAVQFVPVLGGGKATGAIGRTDVDGRVSVGRWMLGPRPGLNVLRAASPGIVDTARFEAIAVPLHRIAISLRSQGYFRIVTADETLENQDILTSGSWNSITPSWSPDGARIAFASDRTGDLEIYVMPADGSGMPVRLTDNAGDDFSPSWSPDNSRLVFVRSPAGSVSLSPLRLPTAGDVYSMRSDGSDEQRLTNHPAPDLFPVWSPDGSQIAFTTQRDGNYEIYLMAPDGSGKENLTNQAAWDMGPTWSPIDDRLGFMSTRSGQPEWWFMNRDGTGRSEIPSVGRVYALPTWAPDGSHLFGIGTDPSTGIVDLYLALSTGRAVRYLRGAPEIAYGVAIRPR